MLLPFKVTGFDSTYNQANTNTIASGTRGPAKTQLVSMGHSCSGWHVMLADSFCSLRLWPVDVSAGLAPSSTQWHFHGGAAAWNET